MKEKNFEALAKVTGMKPELFNEEIIINDIPNFDSLHFVMFLSELEESYNY